MVERQLPKLNVAGSSPVSRSKESIGYATNRPYDPAWVTTLGDNILAGGLRTVKGCEPEGGAEPSGVVPRRGLPKSSRFRCWRLR